MHILIISLSQSFSLFSQSFSFFSLFIKTTTMKLETLDLPLISRNPTVNKKGLLRKEKKRKKKRRKKDVTDTCLDRYSR